MEYIVKKVENDVEHIIPIVSLTFPIVYTCKCFVPHRR